MAATFGSGTPGHSRSSPALSGIIPVVSDRCPPADPPLITSLVGSMPYVFACAATYFNAQRQSSTAAGASETFAIRYSTFTTFQPISSQGRNWNTCDSLTPPTQPPPWIQIKVG